MTWRLGDFEKDLTNEAYRMWDADSGGWFVMFRDNNGAWTAIWKPDIAIWANAIGKGVVDAQAARVPVDVALDVARVRHAKQPVPK